MAGLALNASTPPQTILASREVQGWQTSSSHAEPEEEPSGDEEAAAEERRISLDVVYM